MGTNKTIDDYDVGSQVPQIAETLIIVKQGINNHLLHGRSPKYQEYFKKWAQRTMTPVNGVNHFENLINAMLSSLANQMVGDARTDAIASTQFYRGWICALKDIFSEMQSHSAQDQLLELE